MHVIFNLSLLEAIQNLKKFLSFEIAQEKFVKLEGFCSFGNFLDDALSILESSYVWSAFTPTNTSLHKLIAHLEKHLVEQPGWPQLRHIGRAVAGLWVLLNPH